MRIDILTLFPQMFVPLQDSIIGRAVQEKKVQINLVNFRDFAENKHKKVDDYPFGGGAGMVLLPQPIGSCIDSLDPNHEAYRIYLSPQGKRFEQSDVISLIKKKYIILLCGHYEGVDQRILDLYIDAELSLGDFVLTGGEIPAMAITDSICRYIDGVIAEESLQQESFTNQLLEYPQYTRPQCYKGLSVPEVLRSGNHAKVEEWRKKKALEITMLKRPDLLK